MGLWGWVAVIGGGLGLLGFIGYMWPAALGLLGDIASGVADAIGDDD
jgi:hypothetical protein